MSISGRRPHWGASVASAAWTSTRGSPERTASGCGSARPGAGPGAPAAPRADGQRLRLGRAEAGLERTVDQQAPDALIRHGADELLDVDAAIAQAAALAIGLGDR